MVMHRVATHKQRREEDCGLYSVLSHFSKFLALRLFPCCRSRGIRTRLDANLDGKLATPALPWSTCGGGGGVQAAGGAGGGGCGRMVGGKARFPRQRPRSTITPVDQWIFSTSDKYLVRTYIHTYMYKRLMDS